VTFKIDELAGLARDMHGRCAVNSLINYWEWSAWTNETSDEILSSARLQCAWLHYVYWLL